MTTPPFSTAVIVCAQVCVQRVLLSSKKLNYQQLKSCPALPAFIVLSSLAHSGLCYVTSSDHISTKHTHSFPCLDGICKL